MCGDLALLAVTLFVQGCTFTLGDHNNIEKSGACTHVVAAACDADGPHVDTAKSKMSTEGERRLEVNIANETGN